MNEKRDRISIKVPNTTPADRASHLLSISQIVSDQYAGGKYVDEISRQYIGNCHYDFDATRLGWEGDQLVHH